MAEIKGKLSELIPDDKNLNKHTQYGMSLLEKSVRGHKFGRSILVDKNNRIIAGNGIVETAANIGAEDIRIIETTGDELVVVKRTDVDLDTKEGREMALADNATSAADLEWDMEKMEEIESEWEIDVSDWGIDLPEEEEEAHDDDFDEDEIQAEPVCKEGDIWQLGEHRLMCGDSTDKACIMLLMNGEQADMVFTDPPYGVAIGDKNKELSIIQKGAERCTTNIKNDTLSPDALHDLLVKAMTNCREACKDDASYFVTSPQGGELGMMMMMMKDAGLPVRHILIWRKNSATFSLGRLDYDYQHEPIFYTWTKSHHNYRGGEYRTTVWDYDKPRKCDLHPTMKPVELVANCLKDCTHEGMIVLDVFGGSGTTIIAAEQLGRKARMMELDPHYCDVIIARWEKLTGQKARKVFEK